MAQIFCACKFENDSRNLVFSNWFSGYVACTLGPITVTCSVAYLINIIHPHTHAYM